MSKAIHKNMGRCEKCGTPFWKKLCYTCQIEQLQSKLEALETEKAAMITSARKRFNEIFVQDRQIKSLAAKNVSLKAEKGIADMGFVSEGAGKEIARLQAKLDKGKRTIRAAIETMTSGSIQATGEWQTGMFCGLEDRDIVDRYDACMYGYEKALARVQEWIIDGLEQALESKAQDEEGRADK